ncbi:MAG: lysophospholipid acyltransferase family protein [Anaerolineae bacterium]|jgi:lauroyl/myristoyl acyltransferase|nr:hypothetical protein [Chloroflexota bacterium]
MTTGNSDRTARWIRLGMMLAPRIPRGLGFWLARQAARVLRRRSSAAYSMLRTNLAVVLPGTSERQRDAMAEDALYELACSYFDMVHFAGDKVFRAGLITVEPTGWKRLQDAIEAKQGLLVVAGHVGNFDLGIQWVVAHGMDAQILSLPDESRAQQLMTEFREKSSVVVTPTSVSALRTALRRLRNGGIVATGVDRPMDYADPPVVFFGRPAPLPTGHVRLALQTGAPIVVASCIRQADRSYYLKFWPPLEMQSTGNREQDVASNVRRVLALVEESIQEAPTQWGMLHPVWTPPQANLRD